ncbi:MAG: 3-keto-disaccharide hydrolase [Planctomycetaceae bacterium]
MNRRIRPIASCLLSLIALLAAEPARADDGFRPLFNGQDLSGWVRTNTPEETWTFADGVLVCSGKPIGEIRTQQMYQNFILELEWRHMVPRGNAGVFIWADDITARGVPFHRGIEVQILETAYGDGPGHTTHGDIFPIHGATMTPINGRKGNRAFPVENRSLPSPQWNHYRIECRDGEISLAVNGKVVTRGKDAVPRKGYICLESEGGVVQYRNVKIQELPGEELAPEQVAIADRGYQSLYSGLDLDDWDGHSDQSGWAVNDWVLAFNEVGNQAGRLTSKETFEDIGFVADVRLKSEASRAAIELGGSTPIELNQPEIKQHLEPQGRWNRLEGTLVDGQDVLLVNGHAVALPEGTRVSGRAAVALVASGSVEFCNLYARSLAKHRRED